MNGGALHTSAVTLVTPNMDLICCASHSCPWSWLMEARDTYEGVADGPPGLFGSMVVPGSALISLRRMFRPAPEVGLNNRFSACVRVADAAFIMVDAWP